MALRISKPLVPLCCLLGAALSANIPAAERIYKSVDADGNVTYSSRPPTDAVDVKRITLPENYAPGSDAEAAANREAIKQAVDQYATERKQRERERKEEERRLAEEERRQAEKAQAQEKEIHYYPAYPMYRYHGRPHPPAQQPPSSQPRPPQPRPPHPRPPAVQPYDSPR